MYVNIEQAFFAEFTSIPRLVHSILSTNILHLNSKNHEVRLVRQQTVEIALKERSFGEHLVGPHAACVEERRISIHSGERRVAQQVASVRLGCAQRQAGGVELVVQLDEHLVAALLELR